MRKDTRRLDPNPPIALSRRYSRAILVGGVIVLLLLAALIVLHYFTYRTSMLRLVAESTAGRAEALDSKFREVANHVRSLRLIMEESLAGEQYREQAERLLAYLGREESSGILTFREDIRGREHVEGNIFIWTEGKRPTSEDAEFVAACELLRFQRIDLESYPYFTWSYYISKNGLCALYPWVTLHDLEAASSKGDPLEPFLAQYEKQYWRGAGPEENPGRLGIWSSPEIDSAGMGQVLTHASPIYHNEEFLGVVGVDITLEFIDTFLSQSESPTVGLLVFDAQGLLAASTGPSALPSDEGESAGSLGPFLADQQLEPGQSHRRGRVHLVPARLETTGWTMAAIVPESSLLKSFLATSGFYLAVAVVLVGALAGGHILLQRHYVRPASLLVDHVRSEALEGPEPVPDIPGIWKSLFESLSDTLALRNAAAHLSGVIFQARMNAEGLVVIDYVSTGIADLTGMSPEEFMETGSDYLELMHPDDREDISRAVADSHQTGAGIEEEARLLRKDGSAVWVRIAARPRKGKAGETLWHGLLMDVTDRHEFMKLLEESERKYRAIFEDAQVGLFRVRLRDGLVLMCNNRMARILGYGEADEVIENHSVTECFADFPSFRSALDAVGEGQLFDQLELGLKTPGGESRVARLSGTVNHEDGYAEGVAVNITEEREAQRWAKIHQERLAMAIRAGATGVYDHTVPFSDYEYLGSRWAEIYGYTPEELPRGEELWQWWIERIHPEDRTATLQAYERFMTGETREYTSEYRALHRTGRWLHLLGRARAAERYGDGSVKRIVGVLQDVTEHREAERALIESEEKYRSLFKEMSNGIALHEIICDPDGLPVDYRFLDLNPAYEHLTGLRKPELIGRRGLDVFPKTDRKWIEMCGRVALSGEPVRLEHYSEDLERHYESTVYSPKRGLFTVVFSDITESKREREERERLENRIQQAQKLESLGVLAGGVAHDFNNLLMGILGNADIALDGMPEDLEARENLREIIRSSRRAADLCHQLLAYAGRGRFVVKPLNLNEVIEDVAHLVGISISKNTSVTYDLAEDLPAVEADVTQMRQVIMNLITNASEAILEGPGVIGVQTGARWCSTSYLNEYRVDRDLTEGEYVFVEVVDSGCGMDEETQARIFEPFFTTKFTGRGLGLAAALGIVKGHNGTIHVESHPGEGTTIRVLLPSTARKSRPIDGEGRTASAWRGEGTVLLVDDEPTARLVGERMLRRIGFDVLTAEDGEEGIAVYRRRRDDILCVVLDLTMPRMDGETAYRELRRINPDVRVILTSGYSEQEITSRFEGLGVLGFLQKPYQMADLIPKMQSVSG